MATKKTVSKIRPQKPSTKAKTTPPVSQFSIILAAAFTALSILFAIIAYAKY